jgi:hypothetical protein
MCLFQKHQSRELIFKLNKLSLPIDKLSTTEGWRKG